jgi:hypothetical protein
MITDTGGGDESGRGAVNLVACCCGPGSVPFQLRTSVGFRLGALTAPPLMQRQCVVQLLPFVRAVQVPGLALVELHQLAGLTSPGQLLALGRVVPVQVVEARPAHVDQVQRPAHVDQVQRPPNVDQLPRRRRWVWGGPASALVGVPSDDGVDQLPRAAPDVDQGGGPALRSAGVRVVGWRG